MNWSSHQSDFTFQLLSEYFQFYALNVWELKEVADKNLPIIYIWCICTIDSVFNLFRRRHIQKPAKTFRSPKVIQFDSHFAFFCRCWKCVCFFIFCLGFCVIDFRFVEFVPLKDFIYVISLDISARLNTLRPKEPSIGFHVKNMFLMPAPESYVNRAHSLCLLRKCVQMDNKKSMEKMRTHPVDKTRETALDQACARKTATCDVR